MPGGWRVGGSAVASDAGTVLGSSTGTTITAGGTANTNGSWAQLTASTGSDADGILIQCCSFVVTAAEFSIDVGVGAVGLEQPIVSDLILGVKRVNSMCVWLPISVPSGSRISARAQSTVASATTEVSVVLFSGDYFTENSAQVIDTYGVAPSITHGTQVDPGATAGVDGVWSQLTAATVGDMSGLILALDTLGATTTPTSENIQILIDIGIGPTGSESVLVPNLGAELITTAGSPPLIWPAYFPLINAPVAAGTRLAVRAQCTSATTTTRLFGAVIYGVRE